MTARALMDAAADRAVACEGAQAFRCFLAQDAAADARQVAVDGAAALDAACAAPPRRRGWPLARRRRRGGRDRAGGLAFSDAAEVRARGRRGTAELEVAPPPSWRPATSCWGPARPCWASRPGSAGVPSRSPRSTPRAWAWEAGFEHHRRHRRDSAGRHRPGRSAFVL
ncbi:MAG: hypothetical protein R3F43_05260 [bacterium]